MDANRFETVDKAKLGYSNAMRSFSSINRVVEVRGGAVPIWEMLGLTEDQYNQVYNSYEVLKSFKKYFIDPSAWGVDGEGTGTTGSCENSFYECNITGGTAALGPNIDLQNAGPTGTTSTDSQITGPTGTTSTDSQITGPSGDVQPSSPITVIRKVSWSW